MMRFKFPANRAIRFSAAAAVSAAAASYAVRVADSGTFTISTDPVSTFCQDFHGIIRNIRANFTVALTVADYKYSLRGLQEDSDQYRRKISEVHLRSAMRILKLCEANKGFYVKAGQYVAAQGVVPKEYSTTLSTLQDKVAPVPFKAIKKVLKDNLGSDFSEMFLSINEQPVAAASIAQVHHAVLKSGHEVAIKVQYPGIEQQMEFDTRTISFLAKTIAWLYPEYRFHRLASAFAETMSLELDFVQEARNSERAAKNFRNNKMVKVPCVFWELTTKQVLTMQFYTGRKIDDLDYLNQIGVDPEKVDLNYNNVAKVLVDMFAEMIFVHGHIHGDPHPGNVLVSAEGCDGFSLVLLDHGVYKELDEEFRKEFCQLWEAMILQDSEKIICLGERFGVGKYSRYLPIIFTGRTIESKTAIRGMSIEEKKNLRKQLTFLLKEDLSSFMESLPPEFFSIMRVDGLLRSIIRKLNVSRTIRLLAYAKHAVYGGLFSKLDAKSDSAGKAAFFRFVAELKFIKILMKIIIEAIEDEIVVPWQQKVKNALHSLYSKIDSDFWSLLMHLAFIFLFIRCDTFS